MFPPVSVSFVIPIVALEEMVSRI